MLQCCHDYRSRGGCAGQLITRPVRLWDKQQTQCGKNNKTNLIFHVKTIVYLCISSEATPVSRDCDDIRSICFQRWIKWLWWIRDCMQWYTHRESSTNSVALWSILAVFIVLVLQHIYCSLSTLIKTVSNCSKQPPITYFTVHSLPSNKWQTRVSN